MQYEGELIKWVVFKQKKEFKHWRVEMAKNDQAINKEKNVKIWNLLGERICAMYAAKGVPIQFQPATLDPRKQQMEQYQKTHYILLLDASFSMRGQPWNDLIQCVQEFLKQLENNVLIREKSRISVIRYDSESYIDIAEEKPSHSLVSKIKFTNGGTNF